MGLKAMDATDLCADSKKMDSNNYVNHGMDCISGLFSHGFFQMTLEREVQRAIRYNQSFVLGLIDIDQFGYFNEQKGYIAGDRQLQEIAQLIQSSIRNTDMAARFLGDVFAVVLLETDKASAGVVLERIREKVAEQSNQRVTVSIGAAVAPRDGNKREILIDCALEALRVAKYQGKNATRFFQSHGKESTNSQGRILIVDDDDLNLALFEATLLLEDFDVILASNGADALKRVNQENIDLVLLDVMMPGMTGFECCQRIKSSEATRMLPVVLLTALDDTESKVEGIQSGADDFISKPPNKEELFARIHSLIKVKRLNENLTSIENVLFSLAKTVEAKDDYTQGHTTRVAEYATRLADKLSLSPKENRALRIGGVLHDIGKIGVSREILNKPGALNDEERRIMELHTEQGFNICMPLKASLGEALTVIRHHHEKLDGTGYPDGLKGDEIPIVARIMAVVDIYDALVTDRPYRKAMSHEKAAAILNEDAAGGKLDKKIVKSFLELIDAER